MNDWEEAWKDDSPFPASPENLVEPAKNHPAMNTGLHLASLYRDHDTGRGHPESPARYQVVEEAME
ncbi:MAG TPA: hypothetical protein VGE29_18935, partial [Prosthecobacter sp.]